MHWLNLSGIHLHEYSINGQALCFMWIRTIGINCLLFEKLRITSYVEFVMFFSMLNHWWMRDLCKQWLDVDELTDFRYAWGQACDKCGGVWYCAYLTYISIIFWAYLWKTELNLLVFIHNGQVMARKGKLEDFGHFLSDFGAEDLVSRFIMHLVVWRFADPESES